ncbi:hypothetical protein [Dactylosporangium matsuzakiense]|uniref:hypothetical protein n=1 Tax=Dactylosporangium matsuzakiense TaxID=53360 RepID=UPI0022F32578|nr:hypothetical protein [Dactylosporangium matsuzakiense]
MIKTDYGQFDLLWDDGYQGFDGKFDKVFDGQVNGLAGAASGNGLYLNLARRSDGYPVRIVLLAEPPTLDAGVWEDVVEVSICVPRGVSPRWRTWAGERGGPLDLPPGSYRVRVSARGRDAGRQQELADGPVDSYLLEVWPAQAEPDSIVRTTTTNAAYWHRKVGSRR